MWALFYLYLHNNLKLFLVTHSISSPVRLGGDMTLTCRANKVNRKFIKLALKFCCRMLICVFSGRLLSMPDICHFDRTQLALGPVYESVTHYEWLSAMRSPKVSARWCSSCMEWTVGCQWDGGGQGAQGLGGHHQGVEELEFVFVFGAESFRLNGLVQLCLWQCFYTGAYSFDQIAT